MRMCTARLHKAPVFQLRCELARTNANMREPPLCNLKNKGKKPYSYVIINKNDDLFSESSGQTTEGFCPCGQLQFVQPVKIK